MYLLKVTAKRTRTGLVPVSQEVIGEVEDDPHYWDPVADLILDRMIADGVIPSPDAPLHYQNSTGAVDRAMGGGR